MTVPALFDYRGKQIRSVTLNGDPWFVASDVCAVLEIAEARSSLRSLDEDEKGVHTVHTPGGDQQVSIINEPGLYSLILRSRRPEARAFKRWVTHEVLPSLRKTGRYEVAPAVIELSVDEYERMLDGGKQMVAKIREQQAQIETQQRELEETHAYATELEPSAQAWDQLASTDGDFSVREAANVLNRDHRISTGQRKLFDLLRAWKVIDRANTPYHAHQQHVRLRARTYADHDTGERIPATPQARVTAAGLRYIHRRMLADQAKAIEVAAKEHDLFSPPNGDNVRPLPSRRDDRPGGVA